MGHVEGTVGGLEDLKAGWNHEAVSGEQNHHHRDDLPADRLAASYPFQIRCISRRKQKSVCREMQPQSAPLSHLRTSSRQEEENSSCISAEIYAVKTHRQMLIAVAY